MKLNLIIDLSYILYKNVFLIKENYLLKKELEASIISNLIEILNNNIYDDIYIISDTKKINWRHLFYPKYKSNRKKDESVNWEIVYEIYNNIKEKLRKSRIAKFIEYNALESDDIINYIIKKSNEKSYSNVIVSSDSDLTQLIEMNLSKKYMNIQWNYNISNEKIFVPENYNLFFKNINNNNIETLFMNDFNDVIIDKLDMFINDKKNKIIVNSEEVVFKKIIAGDRSDNVNSILKYNDFIIKNLNIFNEHNIEQLHETFVNFNMKFSKNIGIDGAKTIYKNYKTIYPEKIDFNSDEFVDRLASFIIYSKNIDNNPFIELYLKHNIIFNRLITYLDLNYIPKEIYESFEEYFVDLDRNFVYNKKNDDDILQLKKDDDSYEKFKSINIDDNSDDLTNDINFIDDEFFNL